MPAVEQPNLEEFLIALNGFLDKQSLSEDPSYVRFLDIFCRSVGANDGHLLRSNDSGVLSSVVSSGISSTFDQEFNRAHTQGLEAPSPLDLAFAKKKVLAITELKPGPQIPRWFMDLMNRYELKSLVAVPLLGRSSASGILCAYYRDVCLFDQGTLDRLMVIGKMVGAATEKSAALGRVESQDAKEKISDDYLSLLTSRPFNKIQAYGFLCKMVKQAIQPGGVLCGSLKRAANDLVVTVVDGFGIPAQAISQRYILPAYVERKLSTGAWPKNYPSTREADWGELSSVLKKSPAHVLCHSMMWQNKIQGLVLAWKMAEEFSSEDDLLLRHLAKITALALNVS